MIGKKFRTARKNKGLTQQQLADCVGVPRTKIAEMETGAGKKEPDRNFLIRIAEALETPELLFTYCEECPIRNHVIFALFPELNNIRRDPVAIAARLRTELREGEAALDRLIERMGDRDFFANQNYRETWTNELEQLVDVKRGIEILETELVLIGAHSFSEIRAVYQQQQQKCEAHGHHKPDSYPREL